MKTYKKVKIKNIICLLGYLLVPIFFIILYFLMTETIEDIWQGKSVAEMSLLDNLSRTYHSIPRLGEFFQFIAVSNMTPHLTFGLDLVFRLITALVASGIVYLGTWFIVGKRPTLKYKDLIIYLGIFLLMMITDFGNVLTHRFSHANNYAFAALIVLGFLLPFRLKTEKFNVISLIGILILGFLFGISTEITPIAFLLILLVWMIYERFKKEVRCIDLIKKYKLQTVAIGGLILGLLFFHLGGSVSMYTGDMYAERYGYISLSALLSSPVSQVYVLAQHFWFNIRYVIYAIIMMVMFVAMEATVMKERKRTFLAWQTFLLAYVIIFLATTSLLRVEDDLYARFMSPMLMGTVISVMMFVWHLMERVNLSQKILNIIAGIMLGVGVIMLFDMTFAFARFNYQTSGVLEESIKYTDQGEWIIDTTNVNKLDMSHSPLFDLWQLSPYYFEA